MSTPRECVLAEVLPGVWYLILEEGSFGEFPDNADVYGPFSSEEATCQFLFDGFSNPGSFMSYDYDESRELHSRSTQPWIMSCVERAQRPEPITRYW